MRPLRLMFEGFGSYRDRTDVELHDVERPLAHAAACGTRGSERSDSRSGSVCA